jgi:tetrahydromethanopterin S-methyltransferase subunit B
MLLRLLRLTHRKQRLTAQVAQLTQLAQSAADNLQPSKPPLSEMPRTKQQVYLEMLPQHNTYVTSQQAN